jgi:hypothetical protein
MAAFGSSRQDIAFYLRIDPKTLTKHYDRTIRIARMMLGGRAVANVGKANMAKFPDIREFNGKFGQIGLSRWAGAPNLANVSDSYPQIPCAFEAGILRGEAGAFF